VDETTEKPWRLLAFDRGGSRGHFAYSDALVRVSCEPTIWWHAADRPTLILGPTQRKPEHAPPIGAPASMITVRRQAGGTAVLAMQDVLGLDVFLPWDHPLALADVVEAYRWLGEVWCGALRSLEADVSLVDISGAREDAKNMRHVHEVVRLACFGTLSPYEVTSDNRKLVGLAQVRRHGGLLLQSAIHLSFDAHALAALIGAVDPHEIEKTLRLRAVGLNDVVPAPVGFPAVMEAFEDALLNRLGVRLAPGDWTDKERQHARAALPPGP